MTTANDILTASFLKVGVDSPSATQTASGLISLNNMITNWGGERLLYSVVAESFTVTAADLEYTMGSGGQWDTVRPLKIKSMFLRNSDNYDFKLGEMSMRDYHLIENKSFTARPTFYYFLPEYPLAKVIFNTSPDADYTIYIESIKNFTVFASSTASATLPTEFFEALTYNLAVSLSEDWQRNINDTVVANALRTKGVVEALLSSQRETPRAKFDFVGMGRGGAYDIVADDTIDGGAF